MTRNNEFLKKYGRSFLHHPTLAVAVALAALVAEAAAGAMVLAAAVGGAAVGAVAEALNEKSSFIFETLLTKTRA